jgi:hypothetical protein
MEFFQYMALPKGLQEEVLKEIAEKKKDEKK